MCTQDGNTNKGCYLPPDTYLGIFYLPDHTGYILRRVTPPWTHPIWCDDLHLSGEYVCFPTKGRLFCFPRTYFSEHEHIIFVGLLIQICNTPTCYLKYYCNLWLYSTMTEAEFNGGFFFQNQHLAGKNTPFWGKHIGPWIPFLSQVSSMPITRGSVTWSTEYLTRVGK